jgi:hypothetical protein
MGRTQSTGATQMSKSAQEHIARINEMLDGDITLRDYFAAQILNGYMSNHEWKGGTQVQFAEWAYEFADTMLEAREQGE